MKLAINCLAIFFGCAIPNLPAQQPPVNVDLLSHVTVPGASRYSDVWGLEVNGVEYAVMGTFSSTVVFSLEDPKVPRIVRQVNGSETSWRDIKNWGSHVYVTSESADGVLHMDFSNPQNIQSEYLQLNAPQSVQGCHNLFIDDRGFMYLVGCNPVNAGGVLIFDLNKDPAHPEFVGNGPAIYSHDVFVKNELLYSSNLNEGLSIIDVSDPSAPEPLASFNTPARFVHNAWTNDEGTVLYTTDERTGPHVFAWDVADPDRIRRLGQYIPLGAQADQAVPHNVHYFNGYLVISYYTEGVKIVDARDPQNLIEIGSYNTWDGPSGGFNGCWGAFPFLPSGIMLASDISSGLYVLQPNYSPATSVQVRVLDEADGTPLSSVDIFAQENPFEVFTTRADGTYVFNLSNEIASMRLVIQRAGYAPQIVDINAVKGQATSSDILLVREPGFSGPPQLNVSEANCSLVVSWDLTRDETIDNVDIFWQPPGQAMFEEVKNEIQRQGASFSTTLPLNGPGSYRLQVRSYSGEKSTVFSHIAEVNAVQCFDRGGNVAVFPNPAISALEVRNLGNLGHQYELLDQWGRVVGEGWIGEDTTIDLSGLSGGVYFLRWGLDNHLERILKL